MNRVHKQNWVHSLKTEKLKLNKMIKKNLLTTPFLDNKTNIVVNADIVCWQPIYRIGFFLKLGNDWIGLRRPLPSALWDNSRISERSRNPVFRDFLTFRKLNAVFATVIYAGLGGIDCRDLSSMKWGDKTWWGRYGQLSSDLRLIPALSILCIIGWITSKSQVRDAPRNH